MFGLLGKWFGGGKDEDKPGEAAPGEPVVYKDFEIIPEPYRSRGQWQLAARIRKDVGGETKEHHLIRADLLTDPDDARAQALMKARRLVDERGDDLFD